MRAEISILYKTVRDAEAIVEAVSPDNLKAPPGLILKTVRKGKKFLTQIECKTKPGTFMATIDDLLNAVSVAERTLSAVQEN